MTLHCVSGRVGSLQLFGSSDGTFENISTKFTHMSQKWFYFTVHYTFYLHISLGRYNWLRCRGTVFIGPPCRLLVRPGRGRHIMINPSVCLCVCVSVYPWVYLWNCWTDRHEILWADPLWPWLSPPRVALRQVMYFQFYGGRHIWPQWKWRQNVEAAAAAASVAWRYQGGVWCLRIPCFSLHSKWCTVVTQHGKLLPITCIVYRRPLTLLPVTMKTYAR